MIFVVDDERLIVETLRIILQNEGYKVHAFQSAEDALDHVAHLKPNYLITDVQMSGMNGLELAWQVRKMLPECFIAIMSGHLDTEGARLDSQYGGWHFMEKPFHPDQLLRSVRQVMRLVTEGLVA